VRPRDARQPQVVVAAARPALPGGLRLHVRVAGPKANLEDGATNFTRQYTPGAAGKGKSMYIGIGTIVVIVIIVLVVLMLRR
jgi:hypothetical protein